MNCGKFKVFQWEELSGQSVQVEIIDSDEMYRVNLVDREGKRFVILSEPSRKGRAK
jgi:hypothetical protein